MAIEATMDRTPAPNMAASLRNALISLPRSIHRESHHITVTTSDHVDHLGTHTDGPDLDSILGAVAFGLKAAPIGETGNQRGLYRGVGVGNTPAPAPGKDVATQAGGFDLVGCRAGIGLHHRVDLGDYIPDCERLIRGGFLGVGRSTGRKGQHH